MSDDRQSSNPQDPFEGLDDEYHSNLELDDSSGWRVFIVPGLLVLFLIGAIALTFFHGGGGQPDPRIADRLQNGPRGAPAQVQPGGQPAPVPEGIETPSPVQPAVGGAEAGRTAEQPGGPPPAPEPRQQQ
jgi:hypothetical protein